MTPFKILHGRQPPTITNYIWDSTGNSLANSYMLGRDELLKHNLGNAQKWMKTLADRHQREVSFEVGDQVYVKPQPYRQNFTTPSQIRQEILWPLQMTHIWIGNFKLCQNSSCFSCLCFHCFANVLVPHTNKLLIHLTCAFYILKNENVRKLKLTWPPSNKTKSARMKEQDKSGGKYKTKLFCLSFFFPLSTLSH